MEPGVREVSIKLKKEPHRSSPPLSDIKPTTSVHVERYLDGSSLSMAPETEVPLSASPLSRRRPLVRSVYRRPTLH